MKFKIKLNNIKTIEKIEGYWTNKDYTNLLELFDFSDVHSIAESELVDMLYMAITDFEPEEAAEIMLNYKLGDVLNEGQIQSLSHEMLVDKIAEEYPDITLHYPLFNINQLLYEAYNGKFPRTLAAVLDIELEFETEVNVSKEVILRTLSDLMSEKSLLKRLFSDQLESEDEMKHANGIIWELKTTSENSYQLISSDYWFSKEDFDTDEFSGELKEEEINHQE